MSVHMILYWWLTKELSIDLLFDLYYVTFKPYFIQNMITVKIVIVKTSVQVMKSKHF